VGERNGIRVCLGYPALDTPEFHERLRRLDSRLEPISLPVDPESDWFNAPAGQPHEEPPPWAVGVARERKRALVATEVLLALNVPKDLMSLAPQLRWIQGVGAGVEQFAAAGVRRDRVIVTNASGVSAVSMAEFVIGRLLQIWKRFRESDAHQVTHDFVRTYGRTLAGTTLGIVGMGSIGCEVARRAQAFGVRVLGMKRSYRSGDELELADALYGPDQLYEMLSECDAVVVAAPATTETHHLFDACAFRAMRKGAVLVNVARGSLVDEEALLEALTSRHLAAAALDVFEQEPLPTSSRLWDVPNLYISAHSSVSVDRYLEDVFKIFADNLKRYLAAEPLENAVDMETLGFS
jgi:phosphoglycerate dehydrogenase-like enzyme